MGTRRARRTRSELKSVSERSTHRSLSTSTTARALSSPSAKSAAAPASRFGTSTRAIRRTSSNAKRSATGPRRPTATTPIAAGLEQITTKLGTGDIQALMYGHDHNGLIHTRTSGAEAREYIYDNLNRLSFTLDTTPNGTQSTPYTYDAIGNSATVVRYRADQTPSRRHGRRRGVQLRPEWQRLRAGRAEHSGRLRVHRLHAVRSAAQNLVGNASKIRCFVGCVEERPGKL